VRSDRIDKAENLQHLVLVRHGEGEGDVRRAAWKKGDNQAGRKSPALEEITDEGVGQCRITGRWVVDNLLNYHGLGNFDGYFVSPALRGRQSAAALGLPSAAWQIDPNLDERNRGIISGLHPKEHQQLYPQSFDEMRNDPLHWRPLGGEALIPDVASTTQRFIAGIKKLRAVIALTHRDRIWVAQLLLENLTETQLLATNSDSIHNGEAIFYTSVDPSTGESAGKLSWKRSFNPSTPNDSQTWQRISQ